MRPQSIESQIQALWQRLETWAAANAPQTLQYLNDPATEGEISTLEQALGVNLPLGFRASLKIHNGEDDPWIASVLADGAMMLPLKGIFERWRYNFQSDHLGLEDRQAWAASILAGSINVQGPVKPMYANLKWVPITSCNGDVIRYLDLDPPSGGTRGQLIKTDIESGIWKVLAPSFFDFFRQYVEDLEQDKYLIEEDGVLVSPEPHATLVSGQLPDYLQDVTFERPGTHPVSLQSDVETLRPGQTATLGGCPRITDK